MKRLLTKDDLIDILLDAVEEKEILLLADPRDGQFPENLSDCLELA